MEVSFAITGKDYVILASDQNAARSIIKMKGDEDKIKALGSHLLMAYSGEPGLSYHPSAYRILLIYVYNTGDTVQFAEYVERNLRLQQMRNNHPLRPQAAASWVRRSIADALRSRSPYSVNILLGGFDMAEKVPKLYWMDYLGTQSDVPYAAHGYGSYFALSLLDRYVPIIISCFDFALTRLD